MALATVNTVNQTKNSEHFIANEGSSIYSGFEMDGFTQRLTTATGYTTNGTIMKLAFADVDDAMYDSRILLEAGSITSKVSTKSSKDP